MALSNKDYASAKADLLKQLVSKLGSNQLDSIKKPAVAKSLNVPNRMLQMSDLYVQAAHKMHNIKASVKAATTENIKLKGLQVVDGIRVQAGDRVLVKNQKNEAENGIYVAANENWSRSNDANDTHKMGSNPFTYVEQGNSNNNTGFIAVNPLHYEMDKSPLKFHVFDERKDNAGAIRGLMSSHTTSITTDAGLLTGTGDGGEF